MNLEQYQPLAMRTAKAMEPRDMLIHGAMGAGSEPGELAQTVLSICAAKYDHDNAVEEVGDAFWFAAYCAHATGLQLAGVADGLVGPPVVMRTNEYELIEHEAAMAVLSLNAAAGMLLTLVKAHVFYGKVLDMELYTAALRNYVAALYRVCYTLHMNLTTVLQKNISKLRKRYADKYSDDAAIARADKDGEEAVTLNTLAMMESSPLAGMSAEVTMTNSIASCDGSAGGTCD